MYRPKDMTTAQLMNDLNQYKYALAKQVSCLESCHSNYGELRLDGGLDIIVRNALIPTLQKRMTAITAELKRRGHTL